MCLCVHVCVWYVYGVYAACVWCVVYSVLCMVVRLRLVENCHRKDSFLFKVPKRRGNTMPQGDHKGSTSVGQETEGAGGQHGQEPLLWFPWVGMGEAGKQV